MGLASASDADNYGHTDTSDTSNSNMATDTHQNIEVKNINNKDTVNPEDCNVPSHSIYRCRSVRSTRQSAHQFVS